MDNIIEIRELSYRYGGEKEYAIQDINLDVPAGQFVAIIGPSRAGKSTLCLTLNGLIPHSREGKMGGTVVVNGQNTKESDVKHLFTDTAIVFQDFETQLFSTSAALDVAFGPENLGLPHEEIVSRVEEGLRLVDLQGFERREPSSMSGGQKQRLAIASSLSLHSPIVVMDEPTTDLDPIGKQSVLDLANELRLTGNYTIICVEHEIEELVNANRVILMAGGKVIQDGPPEEVFPQVDLLRGYGVMPIGVCDVLHALGIQSPALRVGDAVAEIRKNGFAIDPACYSRLIAADKAREARYGNVIIDIRNVTFGYNKQQKAVKDVSLQIREHEFLAIMGQNGSGKTTLAKQLNGLLKYDEGAITIYGDDAKKAGIFKLSKNIGYVFQNPDSQIFADDVFQEVAFGPKNHGYGEEEVKTAVTEALEAVGMAGREKDDPFSLTKGERQRVAVASVLAIKPKVLILDEPTTGMDFKEQTGIMELLRRLNEAGSTIIIITHTMWVVSSYAHRAVVMNDGRVVFDGTVREVFANEEELAGLYLKPPQVTQIGNQFGHALLSVDEARECFKKEGGANG